MTDTPPDGTPVASFAGERSVAGEHSGPPTPPDGVAMPASPGARPAPGARSRPGSPRPRRRRRIRFRWRAAFFALAGLVIIAGVPWALLGDKIFVVRSISVTGTHLVTPAEVIAAADVPLGTPLLRVDPGAVTQRVEAAISQVASVVVTEEWPDHLVIAVTERVPVVAVRMAGGGYDLVDPAGVIVRWAKARPAALPLFQTSLSGPALRGNPGVAAAAAVLAELQPWLGHQVVGVAAAAVAAGAGVSAEQSELVTLDLADGKTVRWGDASQGAQKNKELAIFLRHSARYVDVSAPGTVVTR